MLNQHIPSGVLQGQAPLQAYPEAAHSGRFYCPEWEAEMLDLPREPFNIISQMSMLRAHLPRGGHRLR